MSPLTEGTRCRGSSKGERQGFFLHRARPRVLMTVEADPARLTGRHA
jgi:hypothetical protein